MTNATRNPSMPYIRSLYPKNETKVTANGAWIGLMIHCLQAPDKPNMARSLAGGWFRDPSNETSVSALIDQGEGVQTYPFGYKTWGCGNGNDYVIVQTEHVGYAEWTRAQWTTKTMLQCIRNSAKHHAFVWYEWAMKGHGITYYPEFLTLTQVKNRSRSGFLTHNDARLVFKGTSHWDPGPNFPYDLLQQWTAEELDKLTGKNKPLPESKTYTVKRGDTLSAIAYRFDFPGGWQGLAKLNGISNPDSIKIGQVIRLVPKEAPVPGKQTPQQRYDELAKQYGIGADAFNHFRTQFDKVVSAEDESAARRYMVDFNAMFVGKSYTADNWLHLLRAKLNIEDA